MTLAHARNIKVDYPFTLADVSTLDVLLNERVIGFETAKIQALTSNSQEAVDTLNRLVDNYFPWNRIERAQRDQEELDKLLKLRDIELGKSS